MSWLSDRLGVHINLRPLAAPIGAAIGSVIPGVGTVLGAGLGKFLDNMGHGDSFTHAAGQGVLNAGAAYGLGALRNAFSPSSAAGTGIGQQVAQQGAPSGAGGMANITAANLPSMPPPPPMGGGSSFLDSLGGAAKSAGSWAGEHPNAIGAGLQGLGQISGMDATNSLNRARAEQLNYENETQRRRDAALEPIRKALAGQLAQLRSTHYGIAPNPYAPQGG